MEKTKKGFTIVLLVIITALVLSAGTSTFSCGPVKTEGVILVEGTGSIGSSDDNSSENIYTYSFTLYNTGPEDIFVTTVEPELVQSPYIVTHPEEIVHDINQLVSVGSSLTVNGNIDLDSANLTKEDISSLRPIMYLNISSTKTIPYFNNYML